LASVPISRGEDQEAFFEEGALAFEPHGHGTAWGHGQRHANLSFSGCWGDRSVTDNCGGPLYALVQEIGAVWNNHSCRSSRLDPAIARVRRRDYVGWSRIWIVAKKQYPTSILA